MFLFAAAVLSFKIPQTSWKTPKLQTALYPTQEGENSSFNSTEQRKCHSSWQDSLTRVFPAGWAPNPPVLPWRSPGSASSHCAVI